MFGAYAYKRLRIDYGLSGRIGEKRMSLETNKENKIVLYGAGRQGKRVYDFLKSKKMEALVYGFCDHNAENLVQYKDKKIWYPDELAEKDIIYCIAAFDDKQRQEIRNDLGDNAKCIEVNELADYIGEGRVEFNRDFCRFCHVEDMNEYFANAESTLNTFWSEESPFYLMFQKLDLSNIIELGCGIGRHVQEYIENAGQVMLVDIVQENIDICRERFKGDGRVHYYKNDGYDLRELAADSYSALYTYDAMVHFEMIDIYFYLKDIYRVLQKGGRALFHHSNNTRDYKYSFANAPHGRSFMSKDIFAYLSYRAGFTILEQRVIDWGGEVELDCISLLEK